MWNNPANQQQGMEEKAVQEVFDEFFEDVFEEMAGFGEVDELNICENLGDHLIGNVYIKFHNDEDARTALEKLQGRFYGGTSFIMTVVVVVLEFGVL